MEYIEGAPLLEYVETQGLNVEERLRLFVKICRAVSYAHQNLVVHRDIKPSNVLVATTGEPKLLDFGLAKITEEDFDPAQTATAFRAFTPSYASPEQIQGKTITTASDVYSLGVVLYELLTGARPFRYEGKSLEEILQTAAAHEPPPPSSVENSKFKVQGSKSEANANRRSKIQNRKSLKGDLDNITLKALRREPERRYKSVEAFSEDIERHLKGLPVSARPNTVGYRAAKFLERNRIAAAAAVFVIFALISGLAVALWQANVARAERDRATSRFNDVRKLSNSLLFELSPKIEQLPGATEAREILVTRALEYLDSLANESSGDAKLQTELAAAYEKIGDLQGNPANPNFIDLEAAVKSYEKAGAMRRRSNGATPPDANAERQFAENRRAIGNIYNQANDFEASRANTGAALEIYERLVAENPASADLRFGLAKINYDFGLNLQASKQYGESLGYFEKAKSLLSELNREQPRRTELRRAFGEAKIQNAHALSWAEKQAEAETEASEAVAIYENLLAEHPNDVHVRGGMWLIYWLACSIYQEQNDRLAYQFALKALKVVETTVAQDAANVRAKQQLAKSYSTLGQTATTVGKHAEAIAALEKACLIQREIIEQTTKNNRLKSELALSLMRLGSAVAEQGFFEKSLENLAQAEKSYLEILQAAPGDRRSNRNLAATYEQLGKTYEKLFEKERSARRRASANANYRKALDILQQLEAADSLAEADRRMLKELEIAARKFFE